MSILRSKIRPPGASHLPSTPTLEVKGVTVAFPAGSVTGGTIRGGLADSDSNALEAISFQVPAGQSLAVVGPNGAGKSTLFRLIVGAIRPSVGSVHIYGQGPDGHTCIAYVPQRNQIDWSFPVTVKDVVLMGRVGRIGLFRWPRQHDHRAVRESLARVDALTLIDKQIGELSGGQQQRVFIARALAQEARLLLMDEPLSGLDAPSRDAIFKILDTLQDDNVTVLVATHDLDLAASRFDQIMLLNRRIIALGSPNEVLEAGNLLQAYGGRGIHQTS